MKKIVLSAIVIAFTYGVNAQQTVGSEVAVEVKTECVQEETQNHYQKKSKKRRNRMALCAEKPTAEQSSDNPYSFAEKDCEAKESNSKVNNAMSNLKIFIKTKIFRQELN